MRVRVDSMTTMPTTRKDGWTVDEEGSLSVSVVKIERMNGTDDCVDGD